MSEADATPDSAPRSGRALRALFSVLAGLALLAVLLGVFHGFVRDLQFQWNGSRLAVIYAVKLGYPMYVPAGEGGVLNTIYGPLAYYPYFPATLFHEPTTAIGAGQALSLFFYIAPFLAWLAWTLARLRTSRLPMALALTAGFGFLTLTHPGLEYSFFKIHSDGPALLFMGLGLLAVRAGQQVPRPSRLVLAGVLLAAAVWAKQTLVAASLAPLAVLLAQRRVRDTVIFAISALVSALALGAVFVAVHGWEPLRFNLFEIPAGHPWRMDYLSGVASLLVYPLNYAALLAWSTCGAAGLFLSRRGDREAWSYLTGPSLYAAAALLLMPLGVLGYVKDGGDTNSFSPAAYCLLFVVGEAVIALGSAGPLTIRRRFTLSMGMLAIPLLIAAIAVPVLKASTSLQADLERISRNPNQRAFEFLQRRPGQAWFPMLPLAHLSAEGELYHQARALQEREMAGVNITRERIEAQAPDGFRFLIFRFEAKPDDPRTYLLQKFPEFEGPRRLKGLKGWRVYRRTKSAAAEGNPITEP